MNLIKRIISFALVAALSVALAACNSASTSEPSDTNNSSSNKPASSQDTGSHRPEFKDEEEVVAWVDTDGDFDYETVDWAGPKGYVIVIPANGTREYREAANELQAFYKTTADVTLQIVTDASGQTDKEILIGATKRAQSNKDMDEADLAVSVQGNKLVFDGGHAVTAKSAVLKFIRTAPEAGKASVFEITTDFSTTCILDGYEYVWGDEFEGEEVDLTRWGFHQHMSGTPKAVVSYDRDTNDTGDGRLKLHAIRYFDPEREGVQFKMPLSTTTKLNMTFVYGYAEIRARMPFASGTWPSFWTQSNDELSSKHYGVKCNPKYMVEIDVFEVFGNEDGEVVPNIHKWYRTSVYDYATIHNKEGVTHTTWGYGGNKTTFWTCDNPETINQEYHTYGWEWTPKLMSMYVDGEVTMTYDITKSFDDCPDMTGFHDPEFVMFNSHVTTEDASYQVGLIEMNLDALPSEYYIDYFRLYQKKGEGKLYTHFEPSGEYKDRK